MNADVYSVRRDQSEVAFVPTIGVDDSLICRHGGFKVRIEEHDEEVVEEEHGGGYTWSGSAPQAISADQRDTRPMRLRVRDGCMHTK